LEVYLRYARKRQQHYDIRVDNNGKTRFIREEVRKILIFETLKLQITQQSPKLGFSTFPFSAEENGFPHHSTLLSSAPNQQKPVFTITKHDCWKLGIPVSGT
jgi:hypothetical protein